MRKRNYTFDRSYMGRKEEADNSSNKWTVRIKRALKANAFVIFAVLSFMAITAYYMGPSVTHCTDTTYGFGDNTAGPIWKFGLPGGQSPLGSYENYTNYPYGESLYSPVSFSALGQSVLIWGSEKVAGPVCGYNIVNYLGFVSAALVMCGLVYWLLKKRWIAWIAGYAVAFTPYFQYKVGGHPSYGYQALLIGLIWLLLKVLKDRRKGDAIALGLLAAFCFYWDPYFVLLTAVVITSVLGAWLLYSWARVRGKQGAKRAAVVAFFKTQFRAIVIGMATLVLCLLPLAGIRVLAASQINSFVNGARGNVMYDAIHCSNLPWDYIIPSDDNWFAGKFVSASYSGKIAKLHHLCNPSEYTTGVAWAVIVITSLGLLVFAWEKINKRKLFRVNPSIDLKLVVILVGAVVAAAALLALPPAVGQLKLPSYYLLQITDSWRILARFYILVNIGMVVLFAIVLYYISQREWFKKNWQRWTAIVVLFLCLFVQYQAFAPLSGSRSTFSYTKDLSSIYYWLRDQKDITYIAAYPMDKTGESEAIGYYLTYQHIDGKHLLNSTLPNSPQERLRFSIKDLTDPQTLPVLRYLGVQALEIHGLTPEQIEAVPGLKVLKYDDYKSPLTGGKVAIAKIEDGPKVDYAVVLKDKFPLNGTIMVSAVNIEYETQQGATITPEAVTGRNQKDRVVPVCFEVKTADLVDHDTFMVLDNKKNVVAGPYAIDGNYQFVTFEAKEGQVFTLMNKTSHNMRLNNIGCPPPAQ